MADSEAFEHVCSQLERETSLDRLEEALTAFDEALSRDPEDGPSRYQREQVRRRLREQSRESGDPGASGWEG